MRSALHKYVVLLAFSCAAMAYGQVNPHTQIRWPANCRTSDGKIYNWYTDQCQDINNINPGTQVGWPTSCTGGMVYDASINNCIYSINNINPGAQMSWPGSCSSASQVYSPSVNACVAVGTAANPAPASGLIQFNHGGVFGAVNGASADTNGNVQQLGSFRYAVGYQSSPGSNNGIANAAAANQTVIADPSYSSVELPGAWSFPQNQMHYKDSRNGYVMDVFHNPQQSAGFPFTYGNLYGPQGRAGQGVFCGYDDFASVHAWSYRHGCTNTFEIVNTPGYTLGNWNGASASQGWSSAVSNSIGMVMRGEGINESLYIQQYKMGTGDNIGLYMYNYGNGGNTAASDEANKGAVLSALEAIPFYATCNTAACTANSVLIKTANTQPAGPIDAPGNATQGVGRMLYDLAKGPAYAGIAVDGGYSFNLTAAATASGGNTVYTASFPNQAGTYLYPANYFVGRMFNVSGFTNAGNNGNSFICTASSNTTLTLNNPSGVAETHSGTASNYFTAAGQTTSAVNLSLSSTLISAGNASGGNTTYTGNIAAMGGNSLIGKTVVISGFSTGANNGTFTVINAPANTFNLSSVATSSKGVAVYNGTITGGASNTFVGYMMYIYGFSNIAQNNGIFLCVASTATTLTVTNPTAVAETNGNGRANYSATLIVNNPSGVTETPATPGTAVLQMPVSNAWGTLNAFVDPPVAGGPPFATTQTVKWNLTSVGNASGGNTLYAYSANINAAGNAYAGYQVTVAGFTNSQNNGTFNVVSSTSSGFTLANPSGVAETHAATAVANTFQVTLMGGTGFDTNSSHLLCFQSSFHEQTNVTAVSSVGNVYTLTAPLRKSHLAGSLVFQGGMCGYGIEAPGNSYFSWTTGASNIFPNVYLSDVIGSTDAQTVQAVRFAYSASGPSFYGSPITSSTTSLAQFSLYPPGTYAAFSCSGTGANNCSGTVNNGYSIGSGAPQLYTNVSFYITGMSDPTLNGICYSVVWTTPSSVTQVPQTFTCTNPKFSGATITSTTGGTANLAQTKIPANLYPDAEVLDVMNETLSPPQVDGTIALEPNIIPFANGDLVSETNHVSGKFMALGSAVNVTNPYATSNGGLTVYGQGKGMCCGGGNSTFGALAYISNIEPNGIYTGFGGTVSPPNQINLSGAYFVGINFSQGPVSALGSVIDTQFTPGQLADTTYTANLAIMGGEQIGYMPASGTTYLHYCCAGGTLNLDSNGGPGGVPIAGAINSLSPHVFAGAGINNGNTSPVRVTGSCPANGNPEVAITPGGGSAPTWATSSACTLLGLASSISNQWFVEGHIANGSMLFGIDNTGKVIMNAGATVNGNVVPGVSGTPTVGKATCWKTATTQGYCSTQPDSTGSCTCN